MLPWRLSMRHSSHDLCGPVFGPDRKVLYIPGDSLYAEVDALSKVKDALSKVTQSSQHRPG